MSAGALAASIALIALLVLSGAVRSHRDLRRWLGRDPRVIRRALRAAALTLAAALVGWALLRAAQSPPRLTGAGADLVLAIDVSQSMNTNDTAPSRLRRAVRLSEQVVAEAAAVRIGLVLFAGDAFVALPLTQDWDVVLTYLASLDTELISRAGTHLARALDAAASVFDPRSDRPRRILLFTDGEDGGGGIEAALGRVRALGVQVVPVGFGTPEGGEVRARGGHAVHGPDGEVARSRRVDVVLRRVAAATDGFYYREREDAPRAALLLPEPAAEREPDPAPPDPLLAAVALAALLLFGELVLSVRPPALPRGGPGTRAAWLRAPLARARAQLRAAARRSAGRRALGVGAALAALCLLAAGDWSLQARGDALLARGETREALSIYRRLERLSGATAQTRLRIGNALYRSEQPERAVSEYLSVLRRFGAKDPDARFVASYNMGTALLALERYTEASEALWTALLERPDSLEAKFNYEWALERVPPDEEIPLPPSDASDARPPPESAESSASAGEGEGETRSEPRDASPLSEAEAERWLRTIEESPGEPLRRQIAGSMEQSPGRGEGARQSW